MDESATMGSLALLTVTAARLVVPLLPYLLSPAASAMMYVAAELIPGMSESERSNVCVIAYAAGFTVMMALDVAFS